MTDTIAAPRRAGRPLDLAKREAILSAAETVFMDEGYGVSMDRVAEVAGVSKQTIYKHFESKEALFDATIRRRVDLVTQPITAVPPDTPPEMVLRAQGERFLEMVIRPRYACLLRVVMTVQGGTDIGRHFYEEGPRTSLRRLADYLSRQHERGRLRVPAPLLAAEHFFGLLNGHLQMRSLLSGPLELSPDEMEARATAAVRVFMAAYGPEN